MIKKLFTYLFGWPEPDPDIELAKMSAEFPNWEFTVQSLVFNRWLARQSRRMQRLCASEYADDALQVLRAFHAQPFPRLIKK